MCKLSFFGPRLRFLDSVLHGCYYHAVFSIQHKNGWWMFKLQHLCLCPHHHLRLGSVFDWPSHLLTRAVTDDRKITSYPQDVCFLSHLPSLPKPVSTAWAELNVTPRQRCHPPLSQSEGAYFAGAAAAAAVPTSRPGELPASDFTPLSFATAEVSLKCVNNILSDRANVWQQDGRDATCGNVFSPAPTSEVCNLSHPCWWHVDAWDVAQGK